MLESNQPDSAFTYLGVTDLLQLHLGPKALISVALLFLAPTCLAQFDDLYDRVSIAHGGASQHLPFSSRAAFEAAVEMRPDYIETDVQITSDGVLICFHELVLERRTNVEELFPDRFTETEVDGSSTKTWYVNDFTLAEIKTLDYGSWFSPEYASERIVSFQELIDLVRGKVGLYPESKDPDFYNARGVDIDKALHDLFVLNGLHTPEGQQGTPIVIQSFSESSLQRLRELQDETAGFTAFICWTFQPDNTDLDHIPPVGAQEYLKTQAVSRLFLDNIPNIQSSWVTQGLKVGQMALIYGANDMGSLMIEENVVASAGTVHHLTLQEIRDAISQHGYIPRQRNVFYELIDDAPSVSPSIAV